MSKTNKIEFHSVANIFPMMSEKERISLQADIEQNGLNEPVWLFEGKIIDGRNRYLACLAVNIEPKFREYEGTESDLINFVISLNLHRRHLSSSQKACLAVDVLPELAKQAKTNLSKKISAIRKNDNEVLSKMTKADNSRAVAEKIFSVSGGYISLAKQIKEASIELFETVKSGKLTLAQAKKELSKPNNDNEVLSKMTKAETTNISINDFTKHDIKRIQELIKYGMSENNAQNYVLNNKRKPQNNQATKTGGIAKEIKFRIEESEKMELQTLAKQQNISLSELVRSLIKQNISH